MAVSNKSELIICVIDGSGSMDGSKARHVKETLKYLVKRLQKSAKSSNFYLSTVYFSGEAYVYPLKSNDKEHPDSEILQVRYIDPDGFPLATTLNKMGDGTDISSGLKIANEKILKPFFDEKNTDFAVDRVATLILLSDGQHNQGEEPVPIAKDMKDMYKEKFQIITIGYGNFDEPRLLGIASPMNNEIKMQLTTANLMKYVVDETKLCVHFKQVNEESAEALRKFFYIASQTVKYLGEAKESPIF